MNPSAIHLDLYDGVKMFSEMLAGSGYNLTYAGKWHVTASENPDDRGWEQLEITVGHGSQHYKPLEAWRHQKLDETRRWGQVVRLGWGNFVVFDQYELPTPKRLRGPRRLSSG